MHKQLISGSILKNITIRSLVHTIKQTAAKKLLKFIRPIFSIPLFTVPIYQTSVKFALRITLKAWN